MTSLGDFLGDQAHFLIGRRYGTRLVDRFPRFRPSVLRVDDMLARNAGAAIIAVRFLYELRTIGPIAIGMARVPWHTFRVYNALGAVVWSICWIVAGYALGDVAEILLGNLARIENWLFAGAATVAVIAVAVMRLRRAASRSSPSLSEKSSKVVR